MMNKQHDMSFAFLLGYMAKEAGKGDSYGCAMIYLEDCGNALELWNKDMKLIDIPEEDLHEYGREEEPHMTVLYGLHTKDADEVKKSLLKAGKEYVDFRIAGLGIFENDDFDVLIRHGDECAQVEELREQLIDDLETTIKFKDYKPHATVAYLKKGKGKEYVEKYKDTKWNLGLGEISCSTIDFSDRGEKHTKISLER
jgi:2'-5' RNA ligase